MKVTDDKTKLFWRSKSPHPVILHAIKEGCGNNNQALCCSGRNRLKMDSFVLNVTRSAPHAWRAVTVSRLLLQLHLHSCIHLDLGPIYDTCCLPLFIKVEHCELDDVRSIDGWGCHWGYHPVSVTHWRSLREIDAIESYFIKLTPWFYLFLVWPEINSATGIIPI